MHALTSRQAFFLLLLLSTAFRLLASWIYLGFSTGDDVEILETGFATAVDLDFEPWGIRNLLLPNLLVAPVVGVVAGAGVSDPATLIRFSLVPFVLVGSLALWLVYRLGLEWTGRGSVGLLAAAVYAFHPLHIAFSSSAYPRIAACAAILAAAWILSRPGRDRFRGLAAGGLLAVAFAFRYSEVIYAAPLLVLAWSLRTSTHRFLARGIAMAVGFLVGITLTVGVVDWLTWGRPFASLGEFARYTLIERQASAADPQQPLLWYLRRLPHWIPLTLIPFLVAAVKAKNLRWLWAFVLLPLIVLSAIHHKELRYLQSLVPYVALLSAAGAVWLWDRGHRRMVMILLSVSFLIGAERGLRTLERRSIPAVQAARDLVGRDATCGVALSQAWAYGHRLILGNGVQIRDLSVPPRAEELAQELVHVDAAALYREHLEADPVLREVLSQAGFEKRQSYDWGRSKQVELFVKSGSRSEASGQRRS